MVNIAVYFKFIFFIIIVLFIGEVLNLLLNILHIKLSLINVYKTKDGAVQKYGYSVALKILFPLFSCSLIFICSLLAFLYRKDIPDFIDGIGNEDAVYLTIALAVIIFEIYFGFAFLYMGCILADDELIIKKAFRVQRVSYDKIVKNARRCRPVLHRRRLYILLGHKILNVPVIHLHEGLGFTNELMKRCELDVFEEWEYFAAILQGKDIFEGQYIKMKEVSRKGDFNGIRF